MHTSDQVLFRIDNSIVPIDFQISTGIDENIQIANLLSSSFDISEQHNAMKEYQDPEYYDSLTGLPNKKLIFERLGRALSESFYNKQYGALLVLDLDNLKHLNDTQRSVYRDRLLIEIAKRIKSCSGIMDTVAHFEGDEFAILMENISTSEEEATKNIIQFVEKIREALDAPYLLDIQMYCPTPNIGGSLFGANMIRQINLGH